MYNGKESKVRNMKREIIFISAMMVVGAVLGLAVTSILTAIAVPSYNNLLLTVKEKTDFDLMWKNLGWLAKNPTIILVVLTISALVAGVLTILSLNPNFSRDRFRGKIGRLKISLVMLGCFIWVFLLLGGGIRIIGALFYQAQTSDLSVFILCFTGTGVLWLIAGEMGWAGDFSSWKMGIEGREAEPALSFILGGIVGSVLYGSLYLNEWMFMKYLVLVSEVLDKSGEVSYLGFKLLTYESMFMSGMSFGILAGFILTFSPRYLTVRQRLLRLASPAILLVVMLGVISNVYQGGVRKYDLGKRSLAEAVGVPEKASESRAVILFKPEEPFLQEWTMEAKGYSFIGNSVIAMSYENLRKVEDYIERHKQGSVFGYAAKDILVNGYYALFDVKEGVKRQREHAEEVLLPRLILLSKLKAVPVTEENLNYLRSFTDEKKWHISGMSALKLAEGFMHFGLHDEADAWVKKAGERGADISNTTFLKEPVLTKGKIYGRIWVNGKPPRNTKVALLSFSESIERLEKNSTLSRRLLDVHPLNASGSFMFEYLGAGQYLLTLMADKETIPYDIPSEKLKVGDAPGVIKLSKDKPIENLGDIRISFPR